MDKVNGKYFIICLVAISILYTLVFIVNTEQPNSNNRINDFLNEQIKQLNEQNEYLNRQNDKLISILKMKIKDSDNSIDLIKRELSWSTSLRKYETVNKQRHYSKNGYNGVIQEILNHIGSNNKYYVEIGGVSENSMTRYLRDDQMWKGVTFDINGDGDIKEYITPENVLEIFNKYNILKDIDFVNIDTNMYDYHIMSNILNLYKPRFWTTGYNRNQIDCTVLDVNYIKEYPFYNRDENEDYFGNSLCSFYQLAVENGYSFVHSTNDGHNAFFIKNEVLGINLNPYIKWNAYSFINSKHESSVVSTNHPKYLNRTMIDHLPQYN